MLCVMTVDTFINRFGLANVSDVRFDLNKRRTVRIVTFSKLMECSPRQSKECTLILMP